MVFSRQNGWSKREKYCFIYNAYIIFQNNVDNLKYSAQNMLNFGLKFPRIGFTRLHFKHEFN